MKAEVRINAYEVVSRAVEEGVARGWRRAHKHLDDPGPATIQDNIEHEVMQSLSEVLDL